MLYSKYKHKELTKNISKKGGRNNSGKITVRHRGGGNKKRYRYINWKRTFNLINFFIIELVYDSLKTAPIIILQHKKTGEKIQLIMPTGLGLLDSAELLKTKNLMDMEVGSFIYNLEDSTKNRPKYIRAAGTVGQLIQKTTLKQGYGLIKLPSQKLRYFSLHCRAKVGSISNSRHKYKQLQKAGQKRWLGRRPHVRGVAMNPIDHPHGGGEGKTSGGRPSVSFTGKLTKNVPTRSKKKYNSWMTIK